ncbi:hypothetical protein HK405_001514 [Cladochytrium tenue]|nr:hypothetical protein HK405_001514 [Cladochytrium tenue]
MLSPAALVASFVAATALLVSDSVHAAPLAVDADGCRSSTTTVSSSVAAVSTAAYLASTSTASLAAASSGTYTAVLSSVSTATYAGTATASSTASVSACAATTASAVPIASSITPEYLSFTGSTGVNYVATTQAGARYSVEFDCTSAAPLGSSPALLTVIAAPSNCSTDISSMLASFAAEDDVWTTDFLANTLLWPNACGTAWLTEAASALKTLGHSSIYSLSSASVESATALSVSTSDSLSIASGPFVYVPSATEAKLRLAPVYRVYADPYYAFTTGLFPRGVAVANLSEQLYVQAAVGTPDGEAMSAVGVPVPSRLYFVGKASAALPLAGLRLAMKDIYDVAGVRTGCGNRAYYALYSAPTASSFVVERLLAAGAVLVGKTKTSQFANGESPTADWVDQLCPFNPRGEGYQSPSSSSSGSAASMAAYDWLDFAVGSDTGGSIRGPAGVQGLFGIRPSQDAVSLDGVMPLAASMDTSGYFARTPELFRLIGEALYANSTVVSSTGSEQDQATTLLVPYDLWSSYYNSSGAFISTTAAGLAFNSFITSLASHLGATIDRTSFASKWTSAALSNSTLSSYLNVTYPVIIGKYQYDNLATPFISDYKNKTGGLTPFIDPVPLVRWAWAVAQGETVYEDNLSRKQVFSDFLSNTVFPASSTQCSSSLLLYVQSSGSTSYRNAYLSTPSIPSGFSAGRIANLGQVPEVVVPISQVTYNSTISAGSVEGLPVAISILARKGCDLALLKLVEDLKASGIVTSVKTGAAAF